jgi:hypothetical protein
LDRNPKRGFLFLNATQNHLFRIKVKHKRLTMSEKNIKETIGEYLLKLGHQLTNTDENGLKPAQAEEESENVEQDANAVAEAPAPTPQAKSVIESVVKETKFDAEKELEILKAELATYKNLTNEKFLAVAGSVDVITNELVELSKPMDKVKHSPEKNTVKKVVELSKQEVANLSTSDRINYYKNKFNK